MSSGVASPAVMGQEGAGAPVLRTAVLAIQPDTATKRSHDQTTTKLVFEAQKPDKISRHLLDVLWAISTAISWTVAQPTPRWSIPINGWAIFRSR